MSVLKIQVTENHLKLLKHFKWDMVNNRLSATIDKDDEGQVPILDDDKYEFIDLILNGVPEDFDPFTTEDFNTYTDEQKSEWDILYSELPHVLDIVLFNGKFETGLFKTKYHDRNWKKIG